MTPMSNKAEKTANTLPNIDEMFAAGVHYGYSKSRRHPSVSSYIYATKQSGDIINLEKTSELLESAVEFVKSLGSRNKVLLFVGTKPESKASVKAGAESLNMPFVCERWIRGTLTNFPEIKKRIAVLENYRKGLATGELEKYTKKERSVMAKEMEKLAKYYSGLVGLKKSPDALVIVDSRKEYIPAAEALQENIPVVALVNSDSDIKNIDHPVVGNDAGIPSVKLFVDTIVSAYKAGQMSVPGKE